ncbi:hypothetical protein BC834DRAFT_127325 [Gloeopeniophorella convolvens]|nr:hypothetical protein BC834DRAFT_127325 [Gloeopeniophorella convolvens]
MFKSAATKIAHNTTIPSLGGNKDLRPLQDLITAEKAIVTTLAKLSADFTRASEALRHWGLGEGDDLSDTLGGSTKILLQFATALTQLAAHEQAIREHMKAVRSQEEKLDGLRHRRKNVVSKADTAERKLNKMDPGNKNTPAQSELLLRLRDEIRDMDSTIMTDEAKLGDLKRTATKAWMTLKFGGLQECCRKGLIIADAGKLIMTELPQQETEPGQARPFYAGHARTETYATEAQRALTEVIFDTSVPSGLVQAPPTMAHQDSNSTYLMPGSQRDEASSFSADYSASPGDRDGEMQYRTQTYDSGYAPPPPLEPYPYGNAPSTQADELGALPSQSDVHRSQTFTQRFASSPYTKSLDGAPVSQPAGASGPSSGRFATFPVKGRQGSVPVIADPQAGTTASFAQELEQFLGKGGVDEPAPRYEDFDGNYEPPPGPPPGAAPAATPQAGLYGGIEPGTHESGPPYAPPAAQQEDDDSQLAYMEPAKGERRVRFGSRPIQMPRPLSHLDRDALSEDGRTDSASASTPLTPGGNVSPTSPKSQAQNNVTQDRIPTPPPAEEDPEDERALNAAAAREVSRELDMLMYSPPIPPPATPATPAPPRTPSPDIPAPAPLSIPSVPPAVQQSPKSSESTTHPTSPFTRARDRGSGSPTASRGSAEQPSQPSPIIPAPSPHIPSAPSSPTQTYPQTPQQSPLPPPPSIALPPPSSPALSGGTPYRTPTEMPASPIAGQRALPQPPSLTSLHTASPGRTPPPPGARTISAAAFRRPTPRMGSDSFPNPSDTTPLSVKKRGLPSSPYAPRLGGAFGSTPSLPTSQPPEPVPPLPQAPAQEDEFDYISAYYSGGGDELEPPPAINEPRARSSSLR